MKHVIIIQMISCFIVSLFLLVTSGDQMSSEGLLLSVLAFMLFVGGMFALLWVSAFVLGRRIEEDKRRWAEEGPDPA